MLVLLIFDLDLFHLLLYTTSCVCICIMSWPVLVKYQAGVCPGGLELELFEIFVLVFAGFGVTQPSL